MNSTKKGQNLLVGALVLLISNMLVKVIGAVYKIPLTNMLGSQGMAYFSAAYNFYVTIYLISTAGIPVAVSRMVASAEAQGKYRESKRILKVALCLFSIVGFVAMTVMIAVAKKYAAHIGNPKSYLCMYAIAPTLFFICISSTFRGYYQGKKNMTLSAFAQVIEALAKLFVGVTAVYIFLPKKELHVTASYAISGVTIGVVFSLIFALFFHLRERKNEIIPESDVGLVRGNKSILLEIALISLPIAVSSCVTGLTGFVDNQFFTNSLMAVGYSNEQALSFYGAYSSIVVTLFNMPPVLITPLAISLLPNLASARESKSREKADSIINSSFRVASLIAFPCAFGMASVSGGIIRTLYSEEIIEGTAFTNCSVTQLPLSIISISIVFLAMIGITNSILQAWRKEYLPIISALSGIIVKAIFEFVLMRIPGVGINGAAMSTVACHFTIILMNMIFTVKYTGYFPKIRKIFLKPFVSAVLCGAGAFATYKLAEMLISDAFAGRMKAIVCLVPAVVVAVIIYVAALAIMKGLDREDILMLPKGDKICRLLVKLKAMK